MPGDSPGQRLRIRETWLPGQPCYDRQPADTDAVAAWRQRMATPGAQEIYKERASTAECVNALARNRGRQQFVVRGLRKIRAVVLWFALAHNLIRAAFLRRRTSWQGRHAAARRCTHASSRGTQDVPCAGSQTKGQG
jgi:hypothetical protein